MASALIQSLEVSRLSVPRLALVTPYALAAVASAGGFGSAGSFQGTS